MWHTERWILLLLLLLWPIKMQRTQTAMVNVDDNNNNNNNNNNIIIIIIINTELLSCHISTHTVKTVGGESQAQR